jgi:DNA-binding transcriptional regulator PaaX
LNNFEWLLLSYKVPAEPSSKRVAIWRKIRGSGAVYIQSGVCILPKSEEHQRQFKLIKNEIVQSGGDALLFETAALDGKEQEQIVHRFNAERNEEYKEFLGKCQDYLDEVHQEIEVRHLTYAELQENDEEIKKLREWLAKIQKFDFYGAPLLEEAQKQLVVCEQLLDEYAQLVFATEQSRDYK